MTYGSMDDFIQGRFAFSSSLNFDQSYQWLNCNTLKVTMYKLLCIMSINVYQGIPPEHNSSQVLMMFASI